MWVRLLARLAVVVGLVCVCTSARVHAGVQPTRVDRAFQKFWAAQTPAEASAAIDEIVAARVSFQEALRRLKKGRPYSPQKAGINKLTNRTEDGVVHDYLVKVPAGYDPKRRYPVRIQLHGDVHGDPERRERDTTDMGPFEGADQFHVRPYAAADTPWWSADQLLNLRAILDTLKRTYDIDENRVVVAGESDGGTGAYYLGMRDTTPFATFFPANAFVMVLGNEGLALNEQIFPNNLRNKPLFVVNGGRDPLYPTETVDPYIEHMKRNGVTIDYHPQPEAVHDTTWWPQVKATFEQFVTEHPRNPVPDRITWEVAQADRWNRAHWVVIDELAPEPEDPAQSIDPGRFTARKGAANPWPLFAYQPPAARVDVVRAGNLITATAEGVAEFTLLLSPDRIDFRRPVKIVVNDGVIFDGPMVPNVRMLLKWASIDNDRTMLFAAELHVHVEN